MLEAQPPRLGIGVAVTDDETLQLHAGVVFRGAQTSPKILHLLFHARLEEWDLPDGEHHFVWVEVPLDEDRIDGAIAICRRILARSGGRRPAFPLGYGVYYGGAAFTEEGAFPLGDRAVGITCATFVLAVLKRLLGVDLVALDSWPRNRPEDASWHARIVKALRDCQRRDPQRVTDAHIARVASEVGCARYRPEEVAAAAALFNGEPVTHGMAEALANEMVSGFVAGAALRSICEGLPRG